jgi:pantetheine-phosphate adenylyltransferase
MATAVYPGSFDPVTRGHLDIIKRAAKINDHLIVAVLINSAKHPLFTVEERVALLQECCKGIPNVTVESFDGLTVEFAKKRHASVMVRGLRAVTDFENEIQLAQTNHALMPGIETMFLATSIKWSYLSSTIVKEAARYGGSISKFGGSCRGAEDGRAAQQGRERLTPFLMQETLRRFDKTVFLKSQHTQSGGYSHEKDRYRICMPYRHW